MSSSAITRPDLKQEDYSKMISNIDHLLWRLNIISVKEWDQAKDSLLQNVCK